MDNRYWYTFLYTCPVCKKQIRVGFVVVGKDLNSFYVCDSDITDKDINVAKANTICFDTCHICNSKLDNHDIYDKYTCEIAFYSEKEKQAIDVKSNLIDKIQPM